MNTLFLWILFLTFSDSYGSEQGSPQEDKKIINLNKKQEAWQKERRRKRREEFNQSSEHDRLIQKNHSYFFNVYT